MKESNYTYEIVEDYWHFLWIFPMRVYKIRRFLSDKNIYEYYCGEGERWVTNPYHPDLQPYSSGVINYFRRGEAIHVFNRLVNPGIEKYGFNVIMSSGEVTDPLEEKFNQLIKKSDRL